MDTLPLGTDFSTIPLAPSPDGHSNLVNPPSLPPAIIGLSVILITVTLIFLTACIYTNLRSSSKRKLGWDDCFVVLGSVFTLAYNGLLISSVSGPGRTTRMECTFDASYVKRTYAIDLVYNRGMVFVKAATLILYLRIFATTRLIRLLVYIPLVLLFLVYAAMIPVATVYCTPRAGEHRDLLLLERRHATATLALIQGIFGLSADLYIFILPLPMIFKLHLPFAKKLGLLLVFTAGTFAIVASALCLYFRALEYRSKDPTWNGASTEICVIVENYVTIIVSCTPAAVAFWRKHVVPSTFFRSLHPILGSIRTAKSLNSSTAQLNEQPKGTTVDLKYPRPSNYLELSEANKVQAAHGHLDRSSDEEIR